MINRLEYLNQLRSFKDTNLIKVLQGLMQICCLESLRLYDQVVMWN